MDNDTLLAEEMQEQVRATQDIVRKVSLPSLPPLPSFMLLPFSHFPFSRITPISSSSSSSA